MKRKNGFTLIELLAVIVVLAIIALIATPIVMNTIKNSKKGAAERTADNYVEQVETSLMTYRLEHGENLPDGEYEIDSNGNLVGQVKTLTIEMSGTKPSSGTIVIDNGGVKKDGTIMTVGDYDVTYDTTNKTFVASESTENNVEVLCKANATKVSALVYSTGDPYDISSYNSEEVGLIASESGSCTPGVTYTCNLGDGERTFYVLEESGDNVSLILGTNLGDIVSWCKSGNYDSCDADGALESLYEQTSRWIDLQKDQISLASAKQIAAAGGIEFDGSSTGLYYGLPTWLYSYIDENVARGYWILYPKGLSDPSFYMDNEGLLQYGSIVIHTNLGIRPVITISKSQLG